MHKPQPGFTLAEYSYFSTHARTVSGIVASRSLDGLRDGCAR
jgi:hypothetical protein